ncbi:MAG: putative hydro-lyase [Chloroflexota bacterium]
MVEALNSPMILNVSPREIREAVRSGRLTRTSRGMAPGYTQASLVVLESRYAYDFLVFAQRNPKPCPILEVLDRGSYESVFAAPGADVRTDLPRYRVYRNGAIECDVTDVKDFWSDDLVAFLLGCAMSFDAALDRAGIPNRHVEEGRSGSLYNSNIPCPPAGVFRGNMVVSMRPYSAAQAIRAVQVTTRFQRTHGEPVHIGDPAVIGIRDLSKPDYGQPVSIREGDVPVFWACSVTPQSIAMNERLPFMITQSPGHMMVTDIRDDEITVL